MDDHRAAWIAQLRDQLRHAGGPQFHPAPIHPPAAPTAHDLDDHQFCDHDQPEETPDP